MESHIPFDQIKEVTGISDKSTIVNTWRNCESKGGSVEEVTADVIANLLAPTRDLSSQVCLLCVLRIL